MALATKKIGFVVPRYGREVVGGAERLVRGLAEQLHARGYAVEIFATAVLNIHEWKDYYEPGTMLVNGLPVHRFALDSVDLGQLQRVTEKAMAGEPVGYREQLAFVVQSVNSEALYQQLRERSAEFAVFIFAPYLFGTTYFGAQAVLDKAVLLPCMHDEPFAYFAIYRELMEQVRGIIFNAEAERCFAHEKLGLVNQSTAVVGLGFDLDTPQADGAAWRTARGLPPEYLLYSGRLETGKNVALLIDYFERYKAERPGPTALVFTTDRGDIVPPARPDVVTLGFLEEDELRAAYAGATLLCQPSLNESFSIVLMEAWLQQTPVLVHRDCAVTSEHVQRSDGGWTFGDYAEFRAALDSARADQAERARRAAAGQTYVAQEYNWDAVIARLGAALERFAQPLPLYADLSRRGIRRALDFTRERFDDQLAQIIEQVEASLGQGLSADAIADLRGAARIGMPGYEVQSGAPLVGPLIGWTRRNLTSHLREPYLDPIIARQETFNRMLLDTLLPALERSQREQRRLDRQLNLLQQRLNELQQTRHDEQQQTEAEQS